MSLDLNVNYISPDRPMDSSSAIKIRMALKEAEYSQLDVHFVQASSAGARLSGFVGDWLANPRNTHEGQYSLLSRPGCVSDAVKKHPLLKFTELADTIKIREFSEVLVLGKEILIVDIKGEISIHRIKQHVELGNKAVKALKRIGILEAQKAG